MLLGADGVHYGMPVAPAPPHPRATAAVPSPSRCPAAALPQGRAQTSAQQHGCQSEPRPCRRAAAIWRARCGAAQRLRQCCTEGDTTHLPCLRTTILPSYNPARTLPPSAAHATAAARGRGETSGPATRYLQPATLLPSDFSHISPGLLPATPCYTLLHLATPCCTMLHTIRAPARGGVTSMWASPRGGAAAPLLVRDGGGVGAGIEARAALQQPPRAGLGNPRPGRGSTRDTPCIHSFVVRIVPWYSTHSFVVRIVPWYSTHSFVVRIVPWYSTHSFVVRIVPWYSTHSFVVRIVPWYTTQSFVVRIVPWYSTHSFVVRIVPWYSTHSFVVRIVPWYSTHSFVVRIVPWYTTQSGGGAAPHSADDGCTQRAAPSVSDECSNKYDQLTVLRAAAAAAARGALIAAAAEAPQQRRLLRQQRVAVQLRRTS
eukprot:gene7700-biopygen72442